MGFKIGSHLVHHEDMTRLDGAELQRELEGSRIIIEKKIRKAITALSYPYGKFNARVLKATRSAGYKTGCSCIPGLNYKSTDPYILKRTGISGRIGLNSFIHRFRGGSICES